MRYLPVCIFTTAVLLALPISVALSNGDDNTSASRGQSAHTIAGRTLDEWADDLRASNRFVRLRAVKMLGLFGPPAVPELTKVLDDDDPAARYWAAAALGNIAAPADSTSDKLRGLLQGKQPVGVRISAAYALCRLGHVEGALPSLTEGLASPHRGTACAAADFLARIGPPARAAIPALREAAGHSDYHVQHAAEEALRRIQQDSTK